MLVLTRKFMESIEIGAEVRVTVLEIRGGSVKLGVEAPLDRRISRSESPLRVKKAAQETAARVAS